MAELTLETPPIISINFFRYGQDSMKVNSQLLVDAIKSHQRADQEAVNPVEAYFEIIKTTVKVAVAELRVQLYELEHLVVSEPDDHLISINFLVEDTESIKVNIPQLVDVVRSYQQKWTDRDNFEVTWHEAVNSYTRYLYVSIWHVLQKCKTESPVSTTSYKTDSII